MRDYQGNESEDDLEAEGGLKKYAKKVRADIMRELENYSILLEYGVDTAQAGEL